MAAVAQKINTLRRQPECFVCKINRAFFSLGGTTCRSLRTQTCRYSRSSKYRCLHRATTSSSNPLFLPTAFTHAQGLPVIKIETHLIDTTLSVRDADGRIVTGLTQDDFTVVEDGVPQRFASSPTMTRFLSALGSSSTKAEARKNSSKNTRKTSRHSSTRSSNPTTRPSPSASAITFASSATPHLPRHPSSTAFTASTKATWTSPRSAPKKTASLAPPSTTPSFQCHRKASEHPPAAQGPPRLQRWRRELQRARPPRRHRGGTKRRRPHLRYPLHRAEARQNGRARQLRHACTRPPHVTNRRQDLRLPRNKTLAELQ